MFKKLLFAFFAFLIFTTPAFATHLPKENWATMNPTVQVMSYKWQFNGYVVAVGSGSGTVVSADGLVVTNNHVIFDELTQKPLDAFEICITFEVAKEPLCHYTASLMANDKELDLAILKINSKDIFGAKLPPLTFLDFQTSITPREGQEVQVIGYPASGGSTITLSKGQISGFDTFNNFKYFKTDTDFDHGSSGGTVLDSNGHYIGVPTYIRSYAENVGYFLDLNEGRKWLNKHLKDASKTNEKAEQELIRDLGRFMKANEELKYVRESYPYVSVDLPEGWHFFEIDDDRLTVAQKNVNEAVGISMRFENYFFPIDEGYMAKLDEKFIGARQQFPDFKKEAVTFAKQKATRISYTAFNERNTIIYIPYGYSLIAFSYSINLDKLEKQTKALKPVLSSIKLTGPVRKERELKNTVSYEEPPFSISAFENWRIKKPESSHAGDVLLNAAEPGNYEGDFTVSYSFTPHDERGLSSKEKLEDATRSLSDRNAKLVTKKEDVVLDGLTGFSYTYEYEGELYQQIRKRMTMELAQGEYKLVIEYDDLISNFDRNLRVLRQMLESFDYQGKKSLKKAGVYDFGALGEQFKDTQHHRFAGAIGDLADKGIVSGYPDGRFRPEFLVRKAEALKVILESKNHLEKKKGLGKEVNLDPYAKPNKNQPWRDKFLEYAHEKGVIPRHEPWEPYVGLTLGEALQWIMVVYEVPVWQGETSTPYKRSMDKGYELDLIPRGLDDETAKLTRAELAYLIWAVYNQAK